MFDVVAIFIGLVIFLLIGLACWRAGIALVLFLNTMRNHWTGVDVRTFLNEATERAIRITEQEFGHKHSVDEKKRLTFAEGVLNDVIREAGLDVSKFNVKGLLQAKIQEKGFYWGEKAKEEKE